MNSNMASGFEEACLSLQKIVGQVSASVTHELKNQLAIINEQAGLMHDLAGMATERGGLDPQKVALLSERIAERVGHADEIIKRFNTFAHSSDEAVKQVDAYESLALMVELHRRLAAKKQVLLHLAEAPLQPLWFVTRPLFMLGAIFACLESAVDAAPQGGEVQTRVEAGPAGACFVFCWSGGGAAALEPSAGLLAELSARLVRGSEEGRLDLEIGPLSI